MALMDNTHFFIFLMHFKSCLVHRVKIALVLTGSLISNFLFFFFLSEFRGCNKDSFDLCI